MLLKPSARSLALSALLAAASPVIADPPPSPAKKLTVDEEARLRTIRDEARAAEKKGDHKAAAAAYEKALALKPDDDRLLSERGWQLFLAQDLVRAEETTRKAIALNGRARAASLYNLGRILELKNDKAGAAKAYKESITARPNRVVQQALLRVDPTAAPAPTQKAAATGSTDDALAPEPLTAGAADKKCEVVAESKAAAGAITKAQVVSCGNEYEPSYKLVLTAFGQVFNEGMPVDEAAGGNLNVSAGINVDKGYLVVTLYRSESIHGGRDKNDEMIWMHNKQEFVEVCGIGASRKPSCTPQIQLSASEDVDDVVKRAWNLKMTLAADSLTLETDAKSRKKMDSESRQLLGRHPLVFP